MKFIRILPVIPIVLCCLLSGCSDSSSDANLFGKNLPQPKLDATKAIKFPEDHYRHHIEGNRQSAYGTEWWYFTGFLDTTSGERYGFFITYFLYNRSETWEGLLAHFQMACYDMLNEETMVYNIYSPLEDTLYIYDGPGFEMSMGGWSIQHLTGNQFHIVAGDDAGVAFDLIVGAPGDKPMVINGEKGYIDMGGAGLSAYYSGMRMKTEGTMTIAGKAYVVNGNTWLDRQWGNWSGEQGTAAESYAWFSIRFDDGSDLMLYYFMDPETLEPANPYITGTYQDAQGQRTLITQARAVESHYWLNPEEDSRYPLKWVVEMPEIDLSITVTAVYPNQELRGDFPDAQGNTGRYWEGVVSVSGDKTGMGFLEMDGYKLPGPAADK